MMWSYDVELAWTVQASEIEIFFFFFVKSKIFYTHTTTSLKDINHFYL